jgi:hypothetical protein
MGQAGAAGGGTAVRTAGRGRRGAACSERRVRCAGHKSEAVRASPGAGRGVATRRALTNGDYNHRCSCKQSHIKTRRGGEAAQIGRSHAYYHAAATRTKPPNPIDKKSRLLPIVPQPWPQQHAPPAATGPAPTCSRAPLRPLRPLRRAPRQRQRRRRRLCLQSRWPLRCLHRQAPWRSAAVTLGGAVAPMPRSTAATCAGP